MRLVSWTDDSCDDAPLVGAASPLRVLGAPGRPWSL
jgi:hypothetical protein